MIVGFIVLVVLPIGACTAIVGGVLAIGASAPDRSTPAPSTTVPPTPSATESSAVVVPVPAVVGLPGNEARDALEAAGFEVEWGNETVLAASNWVVTAQSATESAPGATITLTVERPEAAPVEQTSGGVTQADAQRVCEEAAIAQYPYGIEFHRLVGLIALEVRDDRWFYKLEVTITNAYGTELEQEMECTVSGTSAAPVIESQYVY